MNDHLCAPESCTGCLACLNVCPHKAITAIESFLGEILPSIDRNVYQRILGDSDCRIDKLINYDFNNNAYI